MNNELDYLRENGPTTATLGYGIGKENVHQVGDDIHGNTVIAKSDNGDVICAVRSKLSCSVCMTSGWAAKLNCGSPDKR